ncbi:MAG: N-formylglutamate amidohydrolase [Candidatus Omnitrophica bacterium]|nr:N-formylglutamate amidohydrolase [Candidatus Omnitrophota bacterium]
MRKSRPAMDFAPFTLIPGETRNMVLESPHHGRWVPPECLVHSRLAKAARRRWDNHIAIAEEFLLWNVGGVVVASRYSRLVCDLNRGADRVDARVCPRWPGARIYEDGGVIVPFLRTRRRVVRLYDPPLEPEEVEKRLRRYWYPYHDELRKRVEENVKRFGQAVLISLHSTNPLPAHAQELRPVIYLGTDQGRSCDAAVLLAMQSILEQSGCRVITQGFYQGAFVTQAYGREPRVQAVQIELDRRYLSQSKIARWKMLEPLAAALRAVTVAEKSPALPRFRRVPASRTYMDPLTGDVWRW